MGGLGIRHRFYAPPPGIDDGAVESADGRYLAFSSMASHLVADDANGERDVFVSDLTAGATSLMSRSTGGGSANGTSSAPSISPDGSVVSFTSDASDLVPDTGASSAAYVVERETGEVVAASVGSVNQGPAPTTTTLSAPSSTVTSTTVAPTTTTTVDPTPATSTDQEIGISVLDMRVRQDDDAARQVVVPVRLTLRSDRPIEVTFRVISGDGETEFWGRLVIQPGSDTGAIQLEIGPAEGPGDEPSSITIELRNPSQGEIVDPEGEVEVLPPAETSTTTVAPTSTTVQPTTTSTTVRPPTTTTSTTVRPPTTTTTTVRPPVSSAGLSAPAGAVRVAAGSSVQAAVDSHPAGTAFVLGSGVHQRQGVTPKSGNGFYGESGAVLDGGGSVAYAFSGSATGVIIADLEIRNFVSPLQKGAIEPAVGGWTIESVDVHDNASAGVHLGPNSTLRDSRVHHNGQIGIKAWGDNVVFDSVEVDHNNTDNHNAGWEAGGSKFAYTTDLVVRDSYVHHNAGPGLWTDIDNERTLFEGNVVTDNGGIGIFHEISFSAVIRNNTVERNGFGFTEWVWGAGITIAASSDVEVYGNTVRDNANGIVGIQQNRGSSTDGRPWIVQNLSVHDNVVERSGVSGVVQDIGDRSVFQRNLRFYDNQWSSDTMFAWDNNWISLNQWRAYGLG